MLYVSLDASGRLKGLQTLYRTASQSMVWFGTRSLALVTHWAPTSSFWTFWPALSYSGLLDGSLCVCKRSQVQDGVLANTPLSPRHRILLQHIVHILCCPMENSCTVELQFPPCLHCFHHNPKISIVLISKFNEIFQLCCAFLKQ